MLTKEDGLNSSVIGQIAELQVAQRFLNKGYDVTKPLIDKGYDYVVFIDNQWLRVQVKLASLYRPSENYEYCRLDLTSGRYSITEYRTKFDLLAIVFQDKLWLIPSEKLTNRYMSLTKNWDIYLI